MIDVDTDNLPDWIFREVGKDIQISQDCDRACTVISHSRDANGTLVRTADIFLVDPYHVRRLIDLSGGVEIPFNTCPDTTDNYNVPYSSLVHEAGHALGIFGFSHPTMFDSIMSYTAAFSRPNCSPYPLDVAAIYALYQSE